MKSIVIAVDGPASSGKSTVSKAIAQALNITYIDSGAMYRGITYGLLKAGMDWEQLDRILDQTDFAFEFSGSRHELIMNGENVEEAIRGPEVTAHVSQVSACKKVREALVAKQRELAQETSVIMDGRDIGTVVFPLAQVKFFVTASVEVRAQRRFQEIIDRGDNGTSLDQVKAQIQARDHYDSHREISPLRQAEDALVIDSSQMSLEEMAEEMIRLIHLKLDQV